MRTAPRTLPLPLAALLAATLLVPAQSLAQERAPRAARQNPALGLGREVLRQHRPGSRGKLRPGLRTLIKGQVCAALPRLLQRKVKLSKRKLEANPDPTFKRQHPMFQRLVKEGWYGKSDTIKGLQTQADGLRSTRKLAANKPLSQVEFLAFDLEATNGRSGKYSKSQGRFLSGYDEVTQFGYVIYRGGKKVGSGSIPIRPDVDIHPKVQQLTKLTPARLAGAKRFEAVAGQILELMKGRVLIGQSAVKKDWSWLVSNFARIGVDMPGPKKMVMDTYYMSFNHVPAGAGLKDLTRRFGVRQTNHHDARYDAEATGGVFFKMMSQQGIGTLGQAFQHQQQGEAIMRQPRPQQ